MSAPLAALCALYLTVLGVGALGWVRFIDATRRAQKAERRAARLAAKNRALTERHHRPRSRAIRTHRQRVRSGR